MPPLRCIGAFTGLSRPREFIASQNPRIFKTFFFNKLGISSGSRERADATLESGEVYALREMRSRFFIGAGMKRSKDGNQKGKESSHNVRGVRALGRGKAENPNLRASGEAMRTLESKIKEKELKPTVGTT